MSHPRPWHRGSVFGPGARRPLDRNQRERYRYLLRTHHRAGRLTPLHMLVGEALLRHLGADGQCDPAYDTLASDAACSARTARRATAVLRGLGLLCWQRRLTRSGWRVEQTSNQYRLLSTVQPTLPLLLPRTGGQSGRQTPRVEIILPVSSEQGAAAACAALARRRAVIEARLLGKA